MNNEVRYLDEARLRPDARWTPTGEPMRPDDAAMLHEEDERDLTEIYNVFFEVMYYLMGDGRAEDWRWPARRYAALISRLCPALAKKMGRPPEMPAALMRQHHVAMDTLRAIHESESEARALLEWFAISRWGGEKGLRIAVMRAYFLARELCPEWLGNVQSMEAMAVAFGEPRKGARQRWSWRANQLLADLPKLTWQRSDRQRRHAREIAKENHAKRRKEKS